MADYFRIGRGFFEGGNQVFTGANGGLTKGCLIKACLLKERQPLAAFHCALLREGNPHKLNLAILVNGFRSWAQSVKCRHLNKGC